MYFDSGSTTKTEWGKGQNDGNGWGGEMSKLFNRKKGALKNGDAHENNYQREISQIKLF